MKTEILNRLLQDRKAKRQFAVLTHMDSGAQAIVYTDGEIHGDLAVDDNMHVAALNAVQNDRSTTYEGSDGEVFMQIYNPPLRMIIVGAVHISQPLARMAAVTGYDVSIVDPRGSFASDDRFPGVHLVNEWPDEAIPGLDPDRRTAIVTLTHDPKIDDPALAAVLRSDVFYIGALGSRRTHAARVARLTEAGFSDDEIGRIHGPVGLALGAISPVEIAVSILAQLTQELHRKESAEAA